MHFAHKRPYVRACQRNCGEFCKYECNQLFQTPNKSRKSTEIIFSLTPNAVALFGESDSIPTGHSFAC